MKTYFKILFVSFLALASCSLKEELTSNASPDSLFKNEQQCKAALNSSYFQIKTIYNYPFFYAVECCNDLMFCATSNKEARMQISPADPGVGATVWNSSYYAIKNANCSINRIAGAPLEDDVKKSLLAEGKIVRAMYYYVLTSFFGDVPFWENEIVTSEDLEAVTSLPRMSADNTRSTLIDELKECVEWLPKTRFCEDPENRAGAALGYMLIAKMAMWNKDWDTAIDALEQIRDIYGDFSQYPLSDVPFSVRNAPESIFEIQHRYVNGGIDFTMALACVCMPKREIGTDMYDGVSIPELGDRSTTYSAARPTSYFMANCISRESADLRKDLLARTPENVPTMLRYSTYVENGSMFNTPPTFAIYMLALTTDYLKKQGGIAEVEKVNIAKAEKLYGFLDSTDFYSTPVAKKDRSRMNVVFRTPSDEMDAKFVKEATAQGLTDLKGHRLVGGCRASIYNAMPMEGVDALIAFMKEFARVNG